MRYLLVLLMFIFIGCGRVDVPNPTVKNYTVHFYGTVAKGDVQSIKFNDNLVTGWATNMSRTFTGPKVKLESTLPFSVQVWLNDALLHSSLSAESSSDSFWKYIVTLE
jgi:hypothetical protein